MRLFWGRVFQTENSQCKGPEVGCAGVLEKHIRENGVSERKSGRRCDGRSSGARG